jgi:hypothetical protein
MLGEHQVELEVARRGRALFPTLLSNLAYEARALAAAGDEAALGDRAQEARDLPVQHAWSYGKLLMDAAGELRAHGRPQAATAWAGRAVDWLRRNSTSGPLGAPARSELALGLYVAGCWEEAATMFRQLAAEFPQNVDYQGRLGVLAARRGGAREALDVDRELEALRRPYLFGRHTLWRARIAALLGEIAKSVELLVRAFSEGVPHGLELHADADLEPLQACAPFQELLRPKG